MVHYPWGRASGRSFGREGILEEGIVRGDDSSMRAVAPEDLSMG